MLNNLLYRSKTVGLSLFASILSLGLSAQTQNPKIDIELSRDTILIGDQIDLQFTVEKDITQVVVFPEITAEATDGVIEPIGEAVIDTLEIDGRKIKFQIKQKITSFEHGRYTFQPFPVLYVEKNITDTLYTDSLKLYVDTYLIDTATYVMEDITTVINEPFTFDELKFYIKDALRSPYTYLGLLLVILAAVGYYLYRRHKNKNRYVRPPEPPHIIAIRELEVIQNERLWENRKYKEYFSRVTDVIRIYIDSRYSVNAMEMTSQEIFDAFKNIELEEREAGRLRDLLILADYVKFAKFIPTQDECQISYNNAYYFIEDTKLMPLEREDDVEDDVTQP